MMLFRWVVPQLAMQLFYTVHNFMPNEFIRLMDKWKSILFWKHQTNLQIQ